MIIKDIGHVTIDECVKKIQEFDKQITAHDVAINDRKDQIRNLETQKERIKQLKEAYLEPLLAELTDGTKYGVTSLT